jgi:hypothetical protein
VSAKALGVIALLALAATCKEEPSRPDPGIVSDGGFAGAPGRNVIPDLPDGFFTDTAATDGSANPIGTHPIGGGGGGSGGSRDGGSRTPDAASTPDRPSTSGCNLIRQDCPENQGCYPGSSGTGGVCRPAGSLIDHASCFDHEVCAPGYLCVEAFGAGSSRQCEKICDPNATYACAGAGCQIYGSGPAGTCRP